MQKSNVKAGRSGQVRNHTLLPRASFSCSSRLFFKPWTFSSILLFSAKLLSSCCKDQQINQQVQRQQNNHSVFFSPNLKSLKTCLRHISTQIQKKNKKTKMEKYFFSYISILTNDKPPHPHIILLPYYLKLFKIFPLKVQ